MSIEHFPDEKYLKDYITNEKLKYEWLNMERPETDYELEQQFLKKAVEKTPIEKIPRDKLENLRIRLKKYGVSDADISDIFSSYDDISNLEQDLLSLSEPIPEFKKPIPEFEEEEKDDNFQKELSQKILESAERRKDIDILKEIEKQTMLFPPKKPKKTQRESLFEELLAKIKEKEAKKLKDSSKPIKDFSVFSSEPIPEFKKPISEFKEPISEFKTPTLYIRPFGRRINTSIDKKNEKLYKYMWYSPLSLPIHRNTKQNIKNIADKLINELDLRISIPNKIRLETPTEYGRKINNIIEPHLKKYIIQNKNKYNIIDPFNVLNTNKKMHINQGLLHILKGKEFIAFGILKSLSEFKKIKKTPIYNYEKQKKYDLNRKKNRANIMIEDINRIPKKHTFRNKKLIGTNLYHLVKNGYININQAIDILDSRNYKDRYHIFPYFKTLFKKEVVNN